jgi:hypothetical protein
MKTPDNMALSSISLAEIIAGYPIAFIVSKVLYAGFISASTINLSLTFYALYLLVSDHLCQLIATLTQLNYSDR